MEDEGPETFNPWSIVHLVFEHLSDQGLHPTLGEGGDPAEHAAELLRALAIEPAAEGNREVVRAVRAHLAEIRGLMLDEPSGRVPPVSQ
jgi:hypothetical protein